MQQINKIFIENHNKGAYPCYRIPGVIVTAKDSILLYYELRLNASDWACRNIGLRRSTDGGETWSELKGLVENKSEVPLDNPVFIASKSGRVHFFYQEDYRRAYHSYSDDDGVTFSEPVEITYVFDKYKAEYNWSLYAMGPGHGIELKDGRLLIPIWICRGEGNAHHPTVVSTIVSDDGGETFKNGEIIYATEEIINPNETTAIELEDGSIMLNIRHSGPELVRAISYSKDGLTGFTVPVLDRNLRDPRCFGSLVKGFSGMLFTNCDFKEYDETHSNRKNLVVRLSLDEGATWAYERELELFSGYSDIAVSNDGKWAYCFYEGEWLPGTRGFPPKNLIFAKFNLEWLSDGAVK